MFDENKWIKTHRGVMAYANRIKNLLTQATQLFRGQRNISCPGIKPMTGEILKRITYRFIADQYCLLDVIAPISVYQCTSFPAPFYGVVA